MSANRYSYSDLPVGMKLLSPTPGVVGKVTANYRRKSDYVRVVEIQWDNSTKDTIAVCDVVFDKLPRKCPHCGAYHACTVRDRDEYPIPPTCASCGKAH